MHRLLAATATALSLALTGCESGAGLMRLRPVANDKPLADATQEPSAFDVLFTPGASVSNGEATAIQVVHLAFDVAQATFPLDGVRDARKIWNHLDELRIEPDLAVRLARNGLRIGVGRPEGEGAIHAILDSARVKLTEERLFAQAGAPLSIEVAPVTEGEPIFTYQDGNRLTGKTFEGGNKLVTIEYEVRAELVRAVDVRITLEIRHDLGVMTWERVDGAIREVPAYNRHVFQELRSTLTLSPGEFLVIGLGETAANPYLLGNRFLVAERGGERFETILFITPRTTPARTAP